MGLKTEQVSDTYNTHSDNRVPILALGPGLTQSTEKVAMHRVVVYNNSMSKLDKLKKRLKSQADLMGVKPPRTPEEYAKFLGQSYTTGCSQEWLKVPKIRKSSKR